MASVTGVSKLEVAVRLSELVLARRKAAALVKRRGYNYSNWHNHDLCKSAEHLQAA